MDSSLFGTLSENDLENINRNVRTLATNKKQIIHDLEVRLSVINLYRSQVAENRRSIMELIIVIQKLMRFEVYKIYNLPLSLSTKHDNILLKYDLETEMLMVLTQASKNPLVRSYLRVPPAAGQVKLWMISNVK